ncbi:hypothetical protein AMS68_001348 [Peltaster fructicola]|uniref:Telomere length regulation protein conserved domain-containing protein n=1 Tax=Peltaster fructicola TaxID=286661 RepID=A0A6H0XMG2_9PEZI|nr:hypothetical protein AMS68_001348 [Peltaster fructicola]
MESLLNEVKASAQAVSNDDSKATFVLREVVSERHERPAAPAAVDLAPVQGSSIAQLSISDHSHALQILQTKPEIDILLTTLRWLISTTGQHDLNLNLPGPTQAKIIYVLIETILPTHWHALNVSGRNAFTECLTSIAGLKALVLSLRRLLTQRTKPGASDLLILDLLEVLEMITQPNDIFSKLWSGLCALLPDRVRFNLTWKEVVNFFGSHVLDDAQGEAVVKLGTNALRGINLTRSASWYASSILRLASTTGKPEGADSVAAASQLFVKSFSPGHAQRDCVLHIARHCVVERNYDILTSILAAMQRPDKRRCSEVLLQCLSTSRRTSEFDASDAYNQEVAGIAGLLLVLTTGDEVFRQELAKIILDVQFTPKSSFSVRQAALLALVNTRINEVSTLLTKAISLFGDQLFIDQGLISRQEAIAHVVLVSSGLIHRAQPALASTAVRSGGFMQAISNRLATSSARARWLGMIVSTAISHLIDKPEAQMSFGTSDMATSEAKQWLGLTRVDDRIGDYEDALWVIDTALKPQRVARHIEQRSFTSELPVINGKQSFGPPRPPQLLQTEVEGDRITELIDGSSDVNDDFKPYTKPDSDPEDSDEDATLVNRDKAKPPVYIRTLMAMLRDTEKAESFQLAIKHAAPLIRRKTGFGKEISDHAEELARLLSGLQDPFDTNDFDDLRLQALIALVLSNATIMAPWLAQQAFAKDYSIAQRSIILTAVGLSGRELAGYKHEDDLNRNFDDATFPSKQLPQSMRAFYDSARSSRLLDIASQHVERDMIQPMALAAADQTTSHLDAVKVRKFSSRADVQRTKRKPAANELAKVFNTAFFQPLLVSFHQEIGALGDASTYFSTPMLLATFLKTLAILLHASGPATLSLTQVTSDFWEMLLHLRMRATGDIMIMEAVLFSFLTLLQVNENHQDLAQNNPKQLMETKEWAELVFERTGGGTLIEGEGEEARIRTLCAGVLTKASEIIAAYQKVLLGSWSGM